MKNKHALIIVSALGLGASAWLWKQNDPSDEPEMETPVEVSAARSEQLKKTESPPSVSADLSAAAPFEADEVEIARSRMQAHAEALEASGDHAAIGQIQKDLDTDAAEHGMAEGPSAETDGPSSEEAIALNQFFSSRIPGEETANEEVKIDQESEEVEQSE